MGKAGNNTPNDRQALRPRLGQHASGEKAPLLQGLEALSERERSIMVLYYHEGVTFVEIAAAMNVSEESVSQTHAQALGRLKQFMLSRNLG